MLTSAADGVTKSPMLSAAAGGGGYQTQNFADVIICK